MKTGCLGGSLCERKWLLARCRLCPIYTDTLHLDMGTIVPAISGPKRPQDFVALTEGKIAFRREMEETFKRPMGKEIPLPAKTTPWNRQCCDRVDHLLHQYLKPLCDDWRGSGGAQGGSFGDDRQALGENLARPGSQVVSAYLESGRICKKIWMQSASTLSAMAAPPASATPARSKPKSPRPLQRAISSPLLCSRATATLKGASP